ncbi:MAG: glycosyltransferase family 87 protein [Thermoguttaceae bacterium]|jgi:alpha-1,2-mannosyltransferase
MIKTAVQSLWPFEPSSSDGAAGAVSPWERLGQAVVIVSLLLGLMIAVDRAVTNGCSDFAGFCNAGRNVLEHQARESSPTLGRYWPSVDVVWVIFLGMPMWLAAGLWSLLGCWSWLGLLGTVRHHVLAESDETTRRRSTLVAGLLVLPLAVDGLCLGTFHVLMVWCMVAGLERAGRGRDCSGGFLLGLAAWMKLLPVLGIAYLLLKRKWKAALIALACTLAIDIGLSVAGYGTQGAWEEHVRWWDKGAAGTAMRQMGLDHVDEDRLSNQSLAITLRRLLSNLGSTDDPVPDEARKMVAIADLSEKQLWYVFLAVTAGLAAAIALFCRRKGCALSPEKWSVEIALVTLATLWFSPVTWSYHPTAALPALAIVLNRCGRRPTWAWIVCLVWLAALGLLALPVARAAGDLLWLSFAVGAALIWLRPQPGHQNLYGGAASK